MASIASTVAIWTATVYAAATGLTALGRLARAGEHLVAGLAAEHRLLACGRLASAQRNIEAAGAYLGETRPEERDVWTEAAERAVNELLSHYPDFSPSTGHGRERDLVCVDRTAGLGIRLVLQSHPGQPADWPNWIARLVRL